MRRRTCYYRLALARGVLTTACDKRHSTCGRVDLESLSYPYAAHIPIRGFVAAYGAYWGAAGPGRPLLPHAGYHRPLLQLPHAAAALELRESGKGEFFLLPHFRCPARPQADSAAGYGVCAHPAGAGTQ